MTQSQALDILKTGANVFLTGEPGSGKTFVTNAYVKYLRACSVPVAVTASTGIAATHVGGMTIHAWSGIGIKKFLSSWEIDRIASTEKVAKRIGKTNVLIIDEISMLDGQTLACVDAVCREVRKSSQPFGGMQVIFVGDFFQLPPVSRYGEAPAAFAFQSATWERAKPVICYLTEQHRQEDEAFLQILSAMRRNVVTSKHRSILEERSIFEADEVPDDVTKLYSHNEDVDKMNLQELSRIEGRERIYAMTAYGKAPLVETIKRGCLSPETLLLKIGATVMFTKNDPLGAFVNGTLGVVEGFDDMTRDPIVRTRTGRVITAEPMDWSIEENGKILATVSQVPLRLAWAITVHKSQGMSLDAAVVNLRGAFIEGQGYVALSRVRSLGGLYLSGLNEMALKVHPQVLSIDEDFRVQSDDITEAFKKIAADELTKLHKQFVVYCGGAFPVPGEEKKTATEFSVTDLRKKHANAYRPWSPEEENQLREHFQAKKKTKEIAQLLGRQPGGIRARLKKLELVK